MLTMMDDDLIPRPVHTPFRCGSQPTNSEMTSQPRLLLASSVRRRYPPADATGGYMYGNGNGINGHGHDNGAVGDGINHGYMNSYGDGYGYAPSSTTPYSSTPTRPLLREVPALAPGATAASLPHDHDPAIIAPLPASAPAPSAASTATAAVLSPLASLRRRLSQRSVSFHDLTKPNDGDGGSAALPPPLTSPSLRYTKSGHLIHDPVGAFVPPPPPFYKKLMALPHLIRGTNRCRFLANSAYVASSATATVVSIYTRDDNIGCL